MKFTVPRVPLWLVVAVAAVIGAASIGVEFVWPRNAAGPDIEGEAGFYAAAGFAAAFLALAGARLVRLLRRTPTDER
jgi:hypothetical protein